MKQQVVILAGGKGMRMSSDTPIPKPLIKIGDKPILWHIMKIFQHHGYNDFILCLGYEAEQIKRAMDQFTEFNIVCVDTGLETMTGGRIKKIEHLVHGEDFFCTYADGLADLDVNKLLDFHANKKQIATISVVHPFSPFGIVEVNDDDSVVIFSEKPQITQWVNGGFFIFDRKIFSYLSDNDTLENDPFERLVADGELNAYKHNGYWKCMDAIKDAVTLNEAWERKETPWKVW